MKRFCQECGKEAKPDHNVCIHCGAKLMDIKPSKEQTPMEDANELKSKQNSNRSKQNQEQSNKAKQEKSNHTDKKRTEVKQRATNNKKPMPKKKKLMVQIGVGLLVLFIGFSIWASNHHSAESVYNRFEEAIQKGDSKKISKLMIHEDGTKVSKNEAKAFLDLVKEEGKREVSSLYDVTRNGKFLGIFNDHKVEGYDQFVSYDEMIDGLSFEFNDEEIDIHDEDEGMDYVLYGPLAPGLYTAKAVFKGEYGETTKEQELLLNSFERDESFITMDIPVSKVVFYLENYDVFDTETAFIKLNDEELKISKEGETEEVGPFILDGSQTVQSVVTMPWGEITSEPFKVDSSYMYMNADIITPEQYEGLTKTALDFSEQFVEGLAKRSTKPFKNISDDGKAEFDAFLEHGFSGDTFFTGQLDSVGVDKDTITIDEDADHPKVGIDIGLNIEGGLHYLDDEPDLMSDTLQLHVQLNYSKDKEKWRIETFEESTIWHEFEEADVLKASKKLHGPGEEAVAKAKEKSLEEEIELFMNNYTEASVQAINYRDYSIMADYVTTDGPRKQEAIDYIDYLDSKDIYEEFYGSELEKLEEIDNGKWKVTVIESYQIQHPDSNKDKNFRTTAVVVKDGDSYAVDELLETNEIE